MKRLKNRYRLVILNDKSFEEKTSFSLTIFNVLAIFSTFILLAFGLIYLAIAYTPLREYIPGYADVEDREKVRILAKKYDSLETAYQANTRYVENIRKILTGNVDKPDRSSEPDPTGKPSMPDSQELFAQSAEDSILRKEFENQDPFELAIKETSREINPEIAALLLSRPLEGMVTDAYNNKEDHLAVDIVAAEGSPIRSVADGIVIYKGFDTETGHTIIIQHPNSLLSIYKHNSLLMKEVGDFVQAAEAVAIIGSSGHLSTGPHLHFELWYNGKAVNPEDYIVF